MARSPHSPPGLLILIFLTASGCGPVTTLPGDLPDYTNRNGHSRIVIQGSSRELAGFPKRGDHARQFVLGPGPSYYCVTARDNDADLAIGHLAENRTERITLSQPPGGPATDNPRFAIVNPHLGVGAGGDCLIQWSIRHNGINALLRIKNGAAVPQQARIEDPRYYLEADTRLIQSPDGSWIILHWWGSYYREFELFAYGVDDRLQLTELATLRGSGRGGGRVLDAVFLADRILHIVWADIDGYGSPLMRIVSADLDVVDRKWTSPKELFRFRNGKIGSTPTVLRLKDESLHYLWDFQGFNSVAVNKGTIAAGGPIYYQSRKNGVTTQLVDDHEEYRAVATGSSIILAYTKRGESQKIYCRVIEEEKPGPVTSIDVAGKTTNSFDEDPFLLAPDGDGKAALLRVGDPATLHHLRIGERP